ncbi:glycosyltransferase [Solibacillus sp. MA9]|uniref:Glycosyltransferase n=1 Tax=Solibacillus palustris TaxID=2908203 RepID=A0ABS9U9M2_9BACL|nr:glycosyltransferase [Solibacillus sp. MA9]MCH7321027.1 glycosyltransferase [Solibacillus sp. MA9]
MENIVVSIHCLAYNHEKFIAEALESFLMQKTNFKFEILIHDDASTDRTQEIIKEYELQHPELIKPIYQSENQYSKENSANTINLINLNRAKGKYIAVCEGDDYWIDPYKLQKQVDYLEKNPDCSLCVHGGYIVTAAEKKVLLKNRSYKKDKDYTVGEVIEGGGGLFLTNSMLFPKKYALERPAFLLNAPVGDYPYAINLSLQGKVYYIDEFMSAYRVGHSGSWTAREYNNIENKKRHYAEIENMLDNLNMYTDYRYSDAITRTKIKTQFYFLLEQRKYDEAIKGNYKEYYLELSLKRKLIIFIDQYSPFISKTLRSIKRGVIGWTSI